MSDRAVVLLAVAAWVGARIALDVPLGAALLVVAAAVVLRVPPLLVVGVAILAGALAVRAEVAPAPPPGTRLVGEVTLVGDPRPVAGAVRVEVRAGSRRLEAWARGPAADVLRHRLAGERVVVAGRLSAPPPFVRARLAHRHIGARLSVERVDTWRAGDPPSRLANGLRRTLVAGAAVLGSDRRALLTGFVLGDDREQSVGTADDFRAAGLTHLLAVSGQNVAFVLALFAPLLVRLRPTGRWTATLALIGFFALVTRFEPSVVRASAMAAVACTAGGLGRPATRLRILALAIAGAVLVDPFLVHSLGFRLSVGASAGILLLSGPLAGRLPGPRPLADALAVTIAAQVGVAPLLVPVFGPLPLVTVPANLVAVPAAGPLMAWGLTAGLVAGLAGDPVDRWLHLPTGLLVDWVAGVARIAASLSLGQLGMLQLATIAGSVAVAVAVGRTRARHVPYGRWCRAAAVAVAVGAVVGPGLLGSTPRLAGAEVAAGARVWRNHGTVVVVVDRATPAALLQGLRRAGIGRIDVLVVARGTRTAGETVAVLRDRRDVRLVLAPTGHRIRDAQAAAAGTTIAVGAVRVRVERPGPVLEVTVETATTPG